jgi:hypothetical protein
MGVKVSVAPTTLGFMEFSEKKSVWVVVDTASSTAMDSMEG